MIPINEINEVIKLKVKPILVDMISSVPRNSADLRKIYSLIPKPENEITEATLDIRKTNPYPKKSKVSTRIDPNISKTDDTCNN